MRKRTLRKREMARGSVSIMLAVLMLPVYTFAGVIVDGSRVSSAGQMTSGAVDLTMNAALASYDDVLKSVYGLFAMSDNEEELKENLYLYFNETISTSPVTGDEKSDEYLRGIAEFFSGPGEPDFNNLIKLQAESFDAKPVENAVLSNPAVMKNQIVEYMKYSGPLSIGRGLITKLGIFKDFKKQNKAVESKVKYEESLGDIQDMCEDIYTNVSDYNSRLKESKIADISEVTSDIDSACGFYRSASINIALCHASSLEIPDIWDTRDLKKEIKRAARDNDKDEIDELSSRLQAYIPYTKDESGNIIKEGSEFLKMISQTDSMSGDQTGYVYRMHCMLYSEYSPFILLNKLYTEYFDKLSETRQDTYRDEYNLFSHYNGIVSAQINNAREIWRSWEENAQNDLKNAENILSEKKSVIEQLTGSLEKASDATDKLENKLDDAEKNGRAWEEAIADLSEGEVKSSMQSEYENSARSLSKEDMKAFSDAVEADIKGLKELNEYLCGFKLEDCDRDFYICSFSDASDCVDLLMNECFRKPEGNVPVNFEEVGDKLTFYKYLSDICRKKDKADSDRAGFMESMNSAGSKSKISDPDLSEAASSHISSVLNGEQLESIFSSSSYDRSEDSYNVEDSKSSDEDDMLDNQKNILGSTSDFLQNLGELAGSVVGEGVDDLYLTEYITEMFSCYTSDKQFTGKGVESVVPEMLSGVQMSSENNVFYKSEVEYILWGSDEMKKNHQYTNALLFGTRFLLNNIYAFTDSEIKAATLAAATAIAGWTGFGIPIVRTVLIMSLALAESVIDVNRLLDGEEVSVYKSSHTWNMKPSGMMNALKNNGAEIAKMASEKAGEKVEDIFNQIENIAVDKTDELTDKMHNFVDDMTSQAVDSAVNAVTGKFQDTAMKVLDSTDELLTQENISEMLLEKLDLSDDEEGDIDSLAVRYMKEFARDKIDDISGVIYSSYADVSGKARDKISDVKNAVSEKISATLEPLSDKVNDKIDEYSDKLKEQVSQGIEKAGTEAKQYAEDMVGNFVNGTSTALTEKINKGSEKAISFGGKSKTASGKSVTLNYKEYLKLFILLNTISDEKESAMLSRIASLVHINMESGMNDIVINGDSYEKPENFDISRAFTMISIDADVKIKLWFTSVFVPDYSVGRDGDESYTYDYSEFGSKEKNISVHSVMSY